MKKFLAILPIFFLISCVTTEKSGQAVYMAQSDYAAALRIELAYSALPRCGKLNSPKLCSDLNIIRKVQKADDVAWDALQEAQAAVRTPGFDDNRIVTAVASATALTKAFVRITDTLGIK